MGVKIKVKMIWPAALMLTFCAATARADVLYDALYTSEHYEQTGSRITGATIGGGNTDFGAPYDMQSADDFTLAETHTIGTVTFDVAAVFYSANDSLPDSILVEFFADDAGAPAETPAASVTLTSYASVTQIGTNGSWGHVNGSEPIYRLGLDLSAENITLDAGTWWISITSASNDNVYYHLATNNTLHQTGGVVYARDSATAHGNTGYIGAYGSTTWTPYNTTPVGEDVGDLAIRIEDASPGTGCAADFNAVNGVTVQDIFDFLTAWLAGNASADVNHVNGVTVQDIFDFVTAWLAGC